MIPAVLILVKRLSISVDNATHRTLKILAAENDCSMNDIVVTAVNEFLRKNENVAPNNAVNAPQ